MQWIDEIVAGLLELYKTNDPYELCDILKIQVERISLSNPMLRSEKSIYFRNFYGSEIIYIRDNLHINYERFFLRHELGHAILHPDAVCSCNKSVINYGQMEKQANYFAFKLTDLDILPYECEGFSMNQIASYVEMPENVLHQMVEGVLKNA